MAIPNEPKRLVPLSAPRLAWPHRLLWIDGGAGTFVGLAMLVLTPWLPGWYGFSRELHFTIAVANLAYELYALALAQRLRRPPGALLLLIVANTAWGLLCAALLLHLWSSATAWGLAHVALEGLAVGMLARWEWRHRDDLRAVFDA